MIRLQNHLFYSRYCHFHVVISHFVSCRDQVKLQLEGIAPVTQPTLSTPIVRTTLGHKEKTKKYYKRFIFPLLSHVHKHRIN